MKRFLQRLADATMVAIVLALLIASYWLVFIDGDRRGYARCEAWYMGEPPDDEKET